MADPFYSSCADVLSVCQANRQDLDALLDPKTGFASRLRDLCQDQLKEILASDVGYIPQEKIDALRMEGNTWALLQCIMPHRKQQFSQWPSPQQLLQENPYTSTSTLAQAIMHSSRLFYELVIVREWLHDTAPPPPVPDAATGYWKFTKYQLMQALRTGNRMQSDGLVREMDPDAPNRDDARGLAADDANYEKTVAQALYACVRAGKLHEAIDLTRKAHQPWRAATIRGSTLFQWRGISSEPRDEDVDDDISTFDDGSWGGNRRRKLWKSACTHGALNSTLPDPERALFASLAPSSQTSAVLKLACRTWEDYLWAQVSIMCEEKQSAEMLRLDGGFWEGGMAAVEKGVAIPSKEEADQEEQEWEKEVESTLKSLSTVQVPEGAPADNPFHVSQLSIILGSIDELLEGFASGIQAGSFDTSSPEFPTLTRFFAHLCLFLQLIDIPVPPLATQVILEAYLQVLEAAGQRKLIAMYAGALGDNAVDRYAMFLTSLELTADVTERKEALVRARDHGLDMQRVAAATAERTIEKVMKILPPLKGPLPPVQSQPYKPSNPELLLLRSIEWTTFMPETYDNALEQANLTIRYFLGTGNIYVARGLLDVLPEPLASIDEPEDIATEYMHYRQLFHVWDLFERIAEVSGIEIASELTKDARIAWLNEYKALVEEAYEKTVKLFTTEWLISDVSRVDGDRRRRELIRVRQIFIPELVIRLHNVLYESRTRLPKNLTRSFELTNIVADSKHKLYEDFVGGTGVRLNEYLGNVRQAVLGGLEGGGSDPFRILIAAN